MSYLPLNFSPVRALDHLLILLEGTDGDLFRRDIKDADVSFALGFADASLIFQVLLFFWPILRRAGLMNLSVDLVLVLCVPVMNAAQFYFNVAPLLYAAILVARGLLLCVQLRSFNYLINSCEQ